MSYGGIGPWSVVARIYFDLRRLGRAIRSPIDCCIAQVAIDHKVLLLHRDADFQRIADVCRLSQEYMRW